MENSYPKSTIRRPLPEKTHLDNDAYGVSSVLGRGSFGITYLGGDLNLHRYVAIKEFFPDGCVRQRNSIQPSIGITTEEFQKAKTNFLHEARALARFNHPNIVQVLSIFEDNNTAYMVLEYLKGKTLMQLLGKQKVIPEQDAVAFTQQIAEALSVVHKAGMLHLDVKPENIMVCDRGRAVLIDFGLNKKLEKSTGNTTRRLADGAQLGSIAYAPPEQHLGNVPMQASADIYALGATLYHLVTGKFPVSAPERAMGRNLMPPYRVNPNISPNVSSTVMRAMQLETNQRPQSMQAFIGLLTPNITPIQTVIDPAKASPAQNAINPTVVLGSHGTKATPQKILPDPINFSSPLIPPFTSATTARNSNKNIITAICIAAFISLWIIFTLIAHDVRTIHDLPVPSQPANGSSDTDTAASDNPVNDLVVNNLSDTPGAMGGSEMGSITGTITNNSDHLFSYVQVEINLYDSGGNQVGSSMDNVNNLEPHGRWNFSAIITADHVDSYKIVNISGW